ncbi:MAG: universal stress protein [Alphaproteobacteria bacterium]
MAIKEILVLVDGGARAGFSIDLAAELAKRCGAHLAGLFLGTTPIGPYLMAAELPASFWEAEAQKLENRMAAAERLFRSRVGPTGLSSEWRASRAAPADLGRVAAEHARYADLAVVGQPDPDAPELFGLTTEAVEELVLDAGGPVLIVPYAGEFKDVGRRAMVAWNGSREAARATRDALGIMRNGADVVVMQINPPGRDHAHRDVPGADIAHRLARHGLKAEAAHVVAEDMQVGDMILSRAADAGADLIIMGAYGHTRLRELVLGGATRHVLRHMTVPVLMSH